MTWGPGRDEVSTLVAGGELERVAPDTALAARLLDDGTRHVESARSAERLGDLTGAHQLAYDALRKAAAALLAVQGLRATSRGGHIAIQDAVQAQFGGPGSPFRSSVEFAVVATLANTLTPTKLAPTRETWRTH